MFSPALTKEQIDAYLCGVGFNFLTKAHQIWLFVQRLSSFFTNSLKMYQFRDTITRDTDTIKRGLKLNAGQLVIFCVTELNYSASCSQPVSSTLFWSPNLIGRCNWAAGYRAQKPAGSGWRLVDRCIPRWNLFSVHQCTVTLGDRQYTGPEENIDSFLPSIGNFGIKLNPCNLYEKFNLAILMKNVIK